jgi:hypothetical protein
MICCGGLISHAAEPPSKVETSVDATRQSLLDIELIKKGVSLSGQQSTDAALNLTTGLQLSDTPSVITAPLNSSAGAVRDAEEKQWMAENWLLAGMQNLSRQETGGAASESASSDAELSSNAEISSQSASTVGQWLVSAVAESERQAKSQNQNSQAPPPASSLDPAVVNPLNAFMRDWIQPEDLTLLTETGAANDLTQIQSLDLERAGGMTRPGSIPFELSPEISVGSSGSVSVGENPFLTGWGNDSALMQSSDNSFSGLNPESDSRFLDQLPTTISPPSRSTVEPTAELPTQKQNEAWQPPARADEKYFPRLKRF